MPFHLFSVLPNLLLVPSLLSSFKRMAGNSVAIAHLFGSWRGTRLSYEIASLLMPIFVSDRFPRGWPGLIRNCQPSGKSLMWLAISTRLPDIGTYSEEARCMTDWCTEAWGQISTPQNCWTLKGLFIKDQHSDELARPAPLSISVAFLPLKSNYFLIPPHQELAYSFCEFSLSQRQW